MSDELQVSVRSFDEATVIDLIGNVTGNAEEVINQAYQGISSDGERNIVFNFRHKDYINSAGIAILIGIVTEARKRDQKLLMTGLSAHFQKIFRMVGLTKYADLHPSVNEALDALKNGGS